MKKEIVYCFPAVTPKKQKEIPRNCTTCERRSHCHNGRGMIIAWHCGRWAPARRYIEERERYMDAKKCGFHVMIAPLSEAKRRAAEAGSVAEHTALGLENRA